jgi:hypothetical protein
MNNMSLAPMSLLVVGTGSLMGLFLQAVPDSPVAIVGQLERVGIVGASLGACVVLWRTLQKKDDQNLQLVKAVSEALVASTDAQKELRKIVEESTRAKEHLTQAIDKLTVIVGGCTQHQQERDIDGRFK